jgi:hypothetical protein
VKARQTEQHHQLLAKPACQLLGAECLLATPVARAALAVVLVAPRQHPHAAGQRLWEHDVGHESKIGAITATHNAIRVHQHTKLMCSGDATHNYIRLAMREHIVTQVRANALQSLALRHYCQ